MTGYKESVSSLEKKESPHKIMLGYDSQYLSKEWQKNPISWTLERP